ncbi:MAG: hypothetical protein ACOX7U_06665 [Desulfitobacteriia bacterium]|jgi:hypothetical protein
MMVSTMTTLVIQCSKCGKLQLKTLSLFHISQRDGESYCCECQTPLLKFTSFQRKICSLKYPCIYCGNSHRITVKRSKVWGEEVLPLVCLSKGLTVGCLGPRQEAEDIYQDLKKEFVQFLYQLVKDEEDSAEFDVFFVVYAIMEKLSKMVGSGKLGCRCGNDFLKVEIMPDRIELLCEKCRAAGIIHTDNKDILRIIDDMGSIFLEESTTWFLNDVFRNQNLQKN